MRPRGGKETKQKQQGKPRGAPREAKGAKKDHGCHRYSFKCCNSKCFAQTAARKSGTNHARYAVCGNCRITTKNDRTSRFREPWDHPGAPKLNQSGARHDFRRCLVCFWRPSGTIFRQTSVKKRIKTTQKNRLFFEGRPESFFDGFWLDN